MAFEDIQTVQICSDGGYKFIVVELTLGDEKKVVIRGNDENDLSNYHAGIFYRTLWHKFHQRRCSGARAKKEEDLCQSCDCGAGVQLKCLGGGRISASLADKTIRIWDRSGSFGLEPEREIRTAALLQAAFPEHRIICGEPTFA